MLCITATPCFLAGAKQTVEVPGQAEVENVILAVSGADIQIFDFKVSKTVTWSLNFLSPMTLEERKANLINRVCKEYGVDLLIDPQFTYSRRILGGGKLTVSGYPAKYVNFRSLNELQVDSLILNRDCIEDRAIFINRDAP